MLSEGIIKFFSACYHSFQCSLSSDFWVAGFAFILPSSNLSVSAFPSLSLLILLFFRISPWRSSRIEWHNHPWYLLLSPVVETSFPFVSYLSWCSTSAQPSHQLHVFFLPATTEPSSVELSCSCSKGSMTRFVFQNPLAASSHWSIECWFFIYFYSFIRPLLLLLCFFSFDEGLHKSHTTYPRWWIN